MNDKDRELVEQVLHAAGTAGTQGWEYLIRYMVLDGLVGAITCAAIIGGAIYAFKLVLKWKPKDSYDADLAYFARGAAMVALCGVIIGFACGVSGNIVQILAPQGAAIHAAIHH